MKYYRMLHHQANTTNPMRKSNACCSPFNKLHFFHFLMGVALFFITNQCKLAFSFIPFPLVVVVASLLVVQVSVCRSNSVYVIDYCLRPPDNCRVPASLFLEHVALMNIFNEGSVAYMNKVLHLGRVIRLTSHHHCTTFHQDVTM